MQRVHGMRSMHPGHPQGPHVLVDDEGLDELRAQAGGDAMPGIDWTPQESITAGAVALGHFGGVPIYRHTCPCDGPTAVRILTALANPERDGVPRAKHPAKLDTFERARVELGTDADAADLLARIANGRTDRGPGATDG
jgi:hypothetical protein